MYVCWLDQTNDDSGAHAVDVSLVNGRNNINVQTLLYACTRLPQELKSQASYDQIDARLTSATSALVAQIRVS